MSPLTILFLLVVVLATVGATPEYRVYNIGAVLSVGDKIQNFVQAIEDVNGEMNTLPPWVRMEGVPLPMDRNPIRTAQNVCNNLISAQAGVAAVSCGQTKLGDCFTYWSQWKILEFIPQDLIRISADYARG